MNKILVAGLTGIETSLGIDGFPLSYFPVCFPFNKIRTLVSGAAFNVAASLKQLGNQINFCTVLGTDQAGNTILDEMATRGISPSFAASIAKESSQSVILYEPSGRRQIHCDLKDIQELVYPQDLLEMALEGVDLVCSGTTNFCRPLLKLARSRKIPVAVDVHAISSLDDPYHQDFLRQTDILFMSHEQLPRSPEPWLEEVYQRHGTGIAVVGCGKEGACMYRGDTRTFTRVQAKDTRPVVNTVGAGDALFSSFIHGYLAHGDASKALTDACVYASWKIGESGASAGFPSLDLWKELCGHDC